MHATLLLSPLVTVCISSSAEPSLHSLCSHPLRHSLFSLRRLRLVGRAVAETEGHRGHTSAGSQRIPAPVLPPPPFLAPSRPPCTSTAPATWPQPHHRRQGRRRTAVAPTRYVVKGSRSEASYSSYESRSELSPLILL